VYVEECLYDLEHHPHERTNLVRSVEHARVRRVLAAILRWRIAEAGEAVPEIVSRV